jgi:hypothetical protein
MNACCNALAMMLLFGLAHALRAAESPVVFARSGQKVTLSIAGPGNENDGLVVLTTHGQSWGEPIIAKHGTAEFTAPKVRVPIVFRPAFLHRAARAIPGELIVYPDRWLPWDTDKQLSKYKDTQFAAAEIPRWLDAWFGSVGFPIEKLSGRKALDRGNWRMLEKPALLILGRNAAGRGPREVGRLAIEHRTNVLVIEADWLDRSTTSAAAIVVTPKHARGALADLRSQRWSAPPTFRRQTVPWPAIANRLTWLDGLEYPLIEEVYSRQEGAASLRVVLNYLPWQEQLGRCEMADELLLRILAETAKGAKDRLPLHGRWCLLYPAVEEIKAEERPVLAAALRSATAKAGSNAASATAAESREIGGYVLDLRGGSRPPDGLFADSGVLKSIEARIDKHTPLLILGDDPHLDLWKWLALDRRRQKSPRPGVRWRPDNLLPPSLESKLRVMETLTQWNILLGDASRETNHANRVNEL